MGYQVAALANGASEPLVMVNWQHLPEAIDSFLELADTFDAEFNKRTIKIMLTLLLGEYTTNTFQLLTPDEQTVLSITRYVGTPTQPER